MSCVRDRRDVGGYCPLTVLRSAPTFGNTPLDVLSRDFDIAQFAVDAVLTAFPVSVLPNGDPTVLSPGS
jgi:hypothetical protein